MATSVSEQQHQVRMEVARLLVGVYSRTTDGKRRRTREPAEHTTVHDCPAINDSVRAASGMGAEWRDEWTWALLRERWTDPADTRREMAAARELLYLLDGSLTTTKEEMRRRAIGRLGLPGSYKPSSIRMVVDGARDGYSSEVLNRIVPVLVADISNCLDAGLLSRWAGKHGTSPEEDNLHADELAEFRARAIELLDKPSNPLYPERLTTHVLACHLQVTFDMGFGGLTPAQNEDDDLNGMTIVPRHEVVGPQLALERRTVLLGGPGSGKSTIAAAYAVWHLESGHTALYVRAADFARRLVTDSAASWEALVAACTAWAGYQPSDVTRARLEETSRSEQGLIVIDGADEVADGVAVEALRTALEELAQAASTLLVTARPGGVRLVGNGWRTWTTDPLTVPRARDILDLWFESSPRKEAHTRALQFFDRGAGVTSIPLLLGFVAILSANRVPPSNENELFDACVELFLARIWKPLAEQRTDDFTIETVRQIVLAIAWNLVEPLDEQGRRSEAWTWSASPSAREILAASPDASVAREIVRVDGLLMARGFLAEGQAPTSQRYQWLHRAIYEHLVASELAARFERDSDTTYPVLRQAVLSPRGWNEVLRRTLARLTSASQEELIRRLARDVSSDSALRSSWELLIRLLDDDHVPPHLRSALAREFAAESRWREALDVDATTALALLTGGEILSTEEAVDTLRAYERATGLQLKLPLPWLQTVAKNREHALWALTEIGTQSADLATELAIPLVEQGVPVPSLPFEATVEEGTRGLLIERIRETAFPTSYPLGQLLVATVRGAQHAAQEIMAGDHRLVLHAFGWNVNLSRRLRHVIARDYVASAVSEDAPPWVNGAMGSVLWSPDHDIADWTSAAIASARVSAIHAHLLAGGGVPRWLEPGAPGSVARTARVVRVDDAVSILELVGALRALTETEKSAIDRMRACVDALDHLVALPEDLDWFTVVPRRVLVEVMVSLSVFFAAEIEWTELFDELGRRAARNPQIPEILRRAIERAPTERWPRGPHTMHPMEIDPEWFLDALPPLAPHVGMLLAAWKRQPAPNARTLRTIAAEQPAVLWNDPRALAVVSDWFSQAGLLRCLARRPEHHE